MKRSNLLISRQTRKAFLLLLIFTGLMMVACTGQETAVPDPTEIISDEKPTEALSPTDEENTEEPAEDLESTQPPDADEGEPAVAEGFVFEDLNNNGQFDGDEPGLTGLSIVALSPDGQRVVASTESNGYFRFEEPIIQHRIFVNTGFFPETFILTTENEFYDTSVLPGAIRSALNFGYRDREHSSIIGTVFDDLNGNGQQDEDETGLAGISVLAIAHDEKLTDASDLTDQEGRFRFDFTDIDHEVMVDEATLPDGYALSSERGVFPLFMPPGFAASNIDFGYRYTTD